MTHEVLNFLHFGLFLKSNVQQETIDRLYAENPIPPSHWIGPSWMDNKKWQHIMELSQNIEKYL